ncbi:hypothetical protein DXG03_005480 [Asterophora parasitica]|uniref:DUF6532 domain-containing protein n=1 Tax=Asterophora parasitica TaxID=117018 RepID=A0A9P7K7J0_9AGAR|nr:hypothetical protein DXG03_005480 [Asterophora parasitica]
MDRADISVLLPPLQALVKAAIQEVIGDALFIDTLSNFQCGAEKIALPKVETSYNLSGCGTAVERRNKAKGLEDSGDYFYPRNQAGLILRTQPFWHQIIVSTINEYIFSGTRGPIAAKQADCFNSSITTGSESWELEAPLLYVWALINDWNMGYLKKSEFNADEFEDVYRGHELFLKTLCDGHPAKYHRLMADLYKQVSNSNLGHSATVVANNSLAILDIDGMDE